jgi:hypothetical protein
MHENKLYKPEIVLRNLTRENIVSQKGIIMKSATKGNYQLDDTGCHVGHSEKDVIDSCLILSHS